jgi:hypothetical protein
MHRSQKQQKVVMKSIRKLSLVFLTAAAFAALPVEAQSPAPTNAPAPAPRPRTQVFAGTVTAIDATAMTITLKARSPNAPDVTVKVTSDTKITKDRQPAVFSDLKEGMRASGNGKKGDDGVWTAANLRISTRQPRPAPPPAQPATPPAAPPPQ